MTVTVYRIATDTPDYTADDLSGEGAGRTGGRWNRIGTPMVNTSSSVALTCLETLVHLAAGSLPLNRYLVAVAIPDAIWNAALVFDARAQVGWDALPPGKVSLDAGENWAAGRASALMIVPSVIVPEESNVLINPAHPDAAAIKARKLRRWTYDSRLV